MQLRLPVAMLIFIGSYLPLSLILLVQDVDLKKLNATMESWSKGTPTLSLPLDHPHVAVASSLICAACLMLSLVILRSVDAKRRISVVDAKHVPADLMNYTFPYIVSFMGIGYDEMTKIAGLFIFLMWMFWLTFRSGQVILNPVLIAFGWRLFEIGYSFAGDNRVISATALSKQSVASGNRYKFGALQDILVIKDVTESEDAHNGSPG